MAAAARSPLTSLASHDPGQAPPPDRSASSASIHNAHGHRSSGYFPAPSSSATTPQPRDDETLSNTLSNAHPPPSQPQPQQQQQPAGYPPSAAPSTPAPGSHLNGKFTEEWDASQRGSSLVDGPATMHRSHSFVSNAGDDVLPSRSNTLKKKPSLRRGGSLRRSSSRRSMKAGSVRSLALQSSSDPDEAHSAFFCPVPTSGNPTEALANRFQAWRKMLKDLITYFREIQTHYEHRSKSLVKLANAAGNISTPPGFLASGGLDDALQIIRSYNKTAHGEAQKAREIEEDVILALTGLRSDLQQKIKEIKNLSGDFKNTVDKEMDVTKRAVKVLQDILGQSELDTALTTGKQDPYLLRLAVDRQLERQMDEENYLHQAHLNLESSGRELESIVVGEIQKAYNAYTGILKREADAAYETMEELRIGPISMPKDHEWSAFVQRDDQFVDPDVPIRQAQHINYPGRDHVACQEIRAGLLERKSKYLKSYTAGWYVLSPTHLHEFKSADKAQAPIMSLYLPEQKLGSHSAEGGSSNKFILKGRQTGTMHRGHTWVFRAESHDTMMAWYEDIKFLTEKTPQERSEFVRGHSRSLSQASHRSASSDGVVDEEDDVPFSADSAMVATPGSRQDLRRPQPGGRFPSDIQVNAQRGLHAPLSPSSVSSSFAAEPADHDAIAAASALPGSGVGDNYGPGRNGQLGYGSSARTPLDEVPAHATAAARAAREDGVNPYTDEPVSRPRSANYGNGSLVVPVGGIQRSQSQRAAAAEDGGSRRSSVHQDGYDAQTYGYYEEMANGSNGPSAPRGSLTNGDPLAPGGRGYFGDVAPVGTSTGARAPSSGRSSKAESLGSGSAAAGDNAHYLVSSQPQQQQPAGPREAAVQARAKGSRMESHTSISNLHVPGEYPKPTPPATR